MDGSVELFNNMRKGDLISVSTKGVKFWNHNVITQFTFVVLSDHYKAWDHNLIREHPTLLLWDLINGVGMLLQTCSVQSDPPYGFLIHRFTGLHGYADDDVLIMGLRVLCRCPMPE